MTTEVTRVTSNSVLIDVKTGKLTIEGVRFFNDILARAGGRVARTNIELGNDADAAQAAADAAQADATQALGETAALRAPQYVMLAASSTLTNERVLTGSTNISLTDGGAGGAVTVALTPNITGSALDMTITPAAPDALHDGGSLNLNGQNAVAANKNGGSIYLNGGQGGANGFGGAVQIVSGPGKYGGTFFFSAGSGTEGGGGFNVVAGDGGQIGGSVSISTGSGTGGGTATAGDLLITTGFGAVKGGAIYFFTGLAPVAALLLDDDGTNSLLGLHGATPVAQSTGWGSPTGTATKTAFNTATVTLPQLAERVKAMIDYAKLRGDYGA